MGLLSDMLLTAGLYDVSSKKTKGVYLTVQVNRMGGVIALGPSFCLDDRNCPLKCQF